MRTSNTVLTIAVLLAFAVGALASWYGAKYITEKVTHAKASVTLMQAHEAARSHDLYAAIVRAAQATGLDPSDYVAHLTLAEYCERAGLTELAVESYKAALGLAQHQGHNTELSRIEKKIREFNSRLPSVQGR